MSLFNHTRHAAADASDPNEIDVDLLGEFLEMTAAPKWSHFFTGPSVRVDSVEGTFGPRIDRVSGTGD